jgi:hypothetical protein
MNTLGWQSLEVLRAMLDWEELKIRLSHATVQTLFHLHVSNMVLFVRWDSERRSLLQQQKQMQHQQNEVFTKTLIGNCEFADLEKKRPAPSTRKEELEIELLRLEQHEDNCLRAKCAADRCPRASQEEPAYRASIEQACEAHQAQRVRCVELMEAFRRDYLG